MMSYRTVYDVLCAKNTHWLDRHKLLGYEERFDVNSKIAQTTQIFKSSMSESQVYNWMENFGENRGYFIL